MSTSNFQDSFTKQWQKLDNGEKCVWDDLQVQFSQKQRIQVCFSFLPFNHSDLQPVKNMTTIDDFYGFFSHSSKRMQF